ncbi:hypothetical protein L596_026066 [Steinernema carpocapsae]|uniref:Uncharacterized protein n=1 Tax=Steinernema carpocapsae TaxID=34508 RepID=A0A4U5M084_STECR|nr:hypothetical protein L596_026066 [Steinernema carpocapsae]
MLLPGRESNPGLARDRRGYSPLYYTPQILSSVISRLLSKAFVTLSLCLSLSFNAPLVTWSQSSLLSSISHVV